MAGLLLAMSSQSVSAEERTIDISGSNSADSYLVYNSSISVPADDIVNAKINARYCYFSSTISGSGVLNIYGGGDRCFLGGEKGKTWPNWTNYTGNVHIYKLAESSYSAGFYGVVLAYGGKSSSPENALADVKSGKVNPSMAINRVTIHNGATMVCETSTNGAGFRIGELNTEAGSTLQGYYKKSRSVYYLLGGLNTDATLAGTIKPTDYDNGTSLSIIKEGTGTYSITGNDNYLSGALRILEGRVLVMNDRAEAESQQLRGALGAKPNATEAIAYVFSKGVLGGTGSIGGMVDNYGTIEPGADGIGVLTLKNYAADLAANLTVRPSSRLRFKVAAADSYDQLMVNGSVNYKNIAEDFSTSDKMPVIEMALEQTADIAIGTEFRVLTVNSKAAGDWHFDVRANKYTWVVEERQENDHVVFVVRLESYADMEIADDPDVDDDADDPIYTMGAYYDDGISDTSDKNTYKTTTETNLRKKASIDSKIIKTLDKGTKVEKVETDGKWMKVKYKDKTGYIRKMYLKKVKSSSSDSSDSSDSSSSSKPKEGKKIVLKDTVNVRKKPSTDSKRINLAYAGDKVLVIKNRDDGWTKIQYHSKKGYVKTEYLK